MTLSHRALRGRDAVTSVLAPALAWGEPGGVDAPELRDALTVELARLLG